MLLLWPCAFPISAVKYVRLHVCCQGEEMPQGWGSGCFVHYGFVKEEMTEIIPDLHLTFGSGRRSTIPAWDRGLKASRPGTPPRIRASIICSCSFIRFLQPFAGLGEPVFTSWESVGVSLSPPPQGVSHLCSAPEPPPLLPSPTPHSAGCHPAAFRIHSFFCFSFSNIFPPLTPDTPPAHLSSCRAP